MDAIITLWLLMAWLPLAMMFPLVKASLTCSGCQSGTAGTKFQLDITGVANSICTDCSSAFNTTLIFDRALFCNQTQTYTCNSGSGPLNESLRIEEFIRAFSPNITARRFRVLPPSGFGNSYEAQVDLTGDPADCSVQTTHNLTTIVSPSQFCDWSAAQVIATPLYV